METKSYESFENMVMKSFDSVSVRKERAVRANEKPYVTKEMRKAIMRRSQLQKKVYYHGTEETTQAFNKQKNYCNRLYKRERRDFYNRLDLKKITDNITFWDTMKPLFSDKGGIRDKIVLIEDNEIISESIEVAEKFNAYFSGTADSLGITENRLLLNPVMENETDVDKCIKKFELHPSIISIKKNVQIDIRFDFSPVTAKDIDSEIGNLDPRVN